MPDIDAAKWLNAWTEENLTAIPLAEDASDMARQADLCVAAAEAEGIPRAAIDAAAGGDLAQFLADRQRALAERGPGA